MPMWRILVYIPDGDSIAPFVAWYKTQDTQVRAKVDAALVALSGIEDWDDPEVVEFKALSGKDEGLGEVILELIQQEGKKQRKRQIRCLGIRPSDRNEFILLKGLEKSGRSPIPADAYDHAHRLRRQYGQERGTVDDYFK